MTDGLGPSQPPTAGALTLVGGAAGNAAIVGLQIEDAWPLPEIGVAVDVQSDLDDGGPLRLVVTGAVEPVEPRVVDAP